jgi:Transposase and inactivated derivatives
VRQLAGEFPVALCCRVLDVPRSSVLYVPMQRASKDLSGFKELILTLLVTHRGFGVRRMHKMLQRMDVPLSRQEVKRAYKELGLLKKLPPRRVYTTDSTHNEPRYPNLVKDQKAEHPDHIWAADVTYFRIGCRVAYLALVMDIFTREILGFEISYANDTNLTMGALAGALKTGRIPLIHHSDQGCTYAAKRYVKALAALGVKLSMAAAGKPQENGFVERLNRTVKEEEIRLGEYRDMMEARVGISGFVQRYNESRIHSSLKYQTPSEVFKAWMEAKAA